MDKKTKRGLKVGLVTVSVGAVLTVVVPKLIQRRHDIVQWVEEFLSAIMALRHLKLPIWVPILLAALLWFLFALLRSRTRKIEESPQDPPEKSYVYDSFNEFPGIKWTWILVQGEPQKIVALCARCSTELYPAVHHARFVDVMLHDQPPTTMSLECEKCCSTLYSWLGAERKIYGQVRRLIEGNLRSGRAKEIVERRRQAEPDGG